MDSTAPNEPQGPSGAVASRDRFLACLLGGAVGAALGAAVEFSHLSGSAIEGLVAGRQHPQREHVAVPFVSDGKKALLLLGVGPLPVQSISRADPPPSWNHSSNQELEAGITSGCPRLQAAAILVEN